ncbi:MAG: 4Fe-4S binding protein [Burkholderiaceae bacterium]|nr:4Fe-4S binding protein [Burkholderiaceae bacterium]
MTRPLAVIDTQRCTGCGWCVPSCPWQLLSLQPQGWRKFSTLGDADACTGCTLCVPRCPFGAIAMQPRTADTQGSAAKSSGSFEPPRL